MSRVLLSLERFLALSEAMANAAVAQEWETLIQVGEERAKLLENLPSDLVAHLQPTEQAQARTILERCQQLDAQTRGLAEERQDAMRLLLREKSPVT